MDATRGVLLVEDDPLLRMTLAEAPTEAGFTVVEAEDDESALCPVAGRDGLDLPLTDINLPGADGFALASAARRPRPGLPVVYASGRLNEADPQRALPGAPFLAKPFSLPKALTTLQGMLGCP